MNDLIELFISNRFIKNTSHRSDKHIDHVDCHHNDEVEHVRALFSYYLTPCLVSWAWFDRFIFMWTSTHFALLRLLHTHTHARTHARIFYMDTFCRGRFFSALFSLWISSYSMLTRVDSDLFTVRHRFTGRCCFVSRLEQ
jgi:hypothetical protein